MTLLSRIVRGVPLGSMTAVWLVFVIAFCAGGIYRVSAWLVGLQFVLPLFGLLSLLWITATCVVRKRAETQERIGLAVASICLAMLAFTFQIVPLKYPAGSGEPVAHIRPPMDGPIIVGWGGDTLSGNYHTRHPDQRWAYDLLVQPAMTGSDNNADYGCWGKPILAPIDSTVVIAIDGNPDRTPGQMVPMDPCGNQIALSLSTGTYLQICHIQNGSITVKEGDSLQAGQPIGRCGNSGHTSEPHIHIHHQRQDPRIYPFGFAEGLRLGFRDLIGNEFPNGGLQQEGDNIEMIGDVIQFSG